MSYGATAEELVRVLAEEMRNEIRELRWAVESSADDGWSSSQVDSMRKRADALEQKLHDLGVKS